MLQPLNIPRTGRNHADRSSGASQHRGVGRLLRNQTFADAAEIGAASTGLREEFHFSNLHAVGSTFVGHGRECDAVGQVRRAVIKEEILSREAIRKRRHITGSNFSKVHTVIGTFQDIRSRITLNCVVGRLQRQTNDLTQTNTWRHRETSVHFVEVQILCVGVVDGVGDTLRTGTVIRGGHDRVTRLGHVTRKLSSEQLDLCNLHAVGSTFIRHGREDQPVGKISGRIIKEEILCRETVCEGRNIPTGDLSEIHSIIGSFQNIGGGITLNSVIGRTQGQTANDRQTDGGSHRETGVHFVEVQVFGVSIINHIGHTFRTRTIIGSSNDSVSWLSHITRSLRTEQFHFSNLHAVCGTFISHRWENQSVRQIGSAVLEEEVLSSETICKRRNVASGDFGEVHSVIGSFKCERRRITLNSVIGRTQCDTIHNSQANGWGYGEPGVDLVEVQIFGIGIVDRIGYSL